MVRLSGRRGRHCFLLAVVWACVLLALGAFAAPARADSLWVLSSNTGGGSGDWFDANNWSPQQVPGSSTNAVLDNGGTALVSSGSASVKVLTIGQTAAFTTNSLVLTGGLLTFSSNLLLGDQTNAFGQATVSGGAVLMTANSNTSLYVGLYGRGLLNITAGGSVNNGGFKEGSALGFGPTGAGTVNVSGPGSTWVALSAAIGYSGTGTLNITNGGSVTDNGFPSVGNSANSTGTVNVLGSNSTWIASPDVGVYGSGIVNITSGGQVNSSGFIVGVWPGGTGTVNVSGIGSALNMTGVYHNFSVGAGGTGTLNITAGGSVTGISPSYFDLGGSSGGTGTVNVSGIGSTLTLDHASIGVNGTGTLNITNGGSATIGGYVQVGAGAGGIGAVNVSGAGSIWDMPNPYVGLDIGGPGTGTLNITDGGRVAKNWDVWVGTGGTGNINVSGVGSLFTMGNTNALWSIGAESAAIVTVTDGGQIANQGIVLLGYFKAGTVSISGAGSTWVLPSPNSMLIVGNNGTGLLSITNAGSVACATNVYLGYYPGSRGTVSLSDTNSAFTAGALFIGGNDTTNAGTGLLTIGPGATVNVTNSVTVWTPGTLSLQGGQLNALLVQLNGGTIGGWSTLASSIIVNTNSTLVASDSNKALVLSGVVTNTTNQTLTKTGPGTLVLAGTQWNYPGSSFIAAAGVTQINADAGGPLSGGGGGATPNLAVRTTNPAGSGGGPPTVLNFGATQHLHALTVGTNTIVSLDTNGGRVIVTDSLTLAGSTSNAPAGTLQLHDNGLIVHNGNLLAVRAAIKAGYHDGAWDGPGIVTDLSGTNANPGAGAGAGKAKALGYALGSDTNLAISSLDGQAISPADVVVKYTYAGDANMDGSVDGLDIAAWAQNFTGALNLDPTADPVRGWTQGDWNFDGSVDGLDAAIWASNFTGALGGGGLGMVVDAPGANPAAVATLEGMGITVVPEPASLVLLGMGGVMILRRRANRTAC